MDVRSVCNCRCPPQFGHIMNSRFSNSEWGVYLKGGSGALLPSQQPLRLPPTTAVAAAAAAAAACAWGVDGAEGVAHAALLAASDPATCAQLLVWPTALVYTQCSSQSRHPYLLPPLPSAHVAYFLVSGNTIFNHGSTGFAAGQGTGFEYTVAPWIQYEAYAIKVRGACLKGIVFGNTSRCVQRSLLAPILVANPPHPHAAHSPPLHPQFVNNVVRDIEGAGFGIWGCYDCLYGERKGDRWMQHMQCVYIVSRQAVELRAHSLHPACLMQHTTRWCGWDGAATPLKSSLGCVPATMPVSLGWLPSGKAVRLYTKPRSSGAPRPARSSAHQRQTAPTALFPLFRGCAHLRCAVPCGRLGPLCPGQY